VNVFNQVVSAVINTLLAIPPIRFVMGLVDARWRPLWAALWLAVIGYVISRTLNQLALRRARLHLLARVGDPYEGKPRDLIRDRGDVTMSSAQEPPTREPPPREAVPTGPTSPSGVVSIPIPVLLGALAIGLLAVVGVAVATRSAPNAPAAAAAPAAADSVVRPDGPIDVRFRSGRMNGDDCIGTFEVTHGAGTPARLVAFVMDTSGAVMARDSAQVAAAVAGLFVDFRFRHVDCDEIDDWQLQATTPKRPGRSP
jgi:hypothetical protein